MAKNAPSPHDVEVQTCFESKLQPLPCNAPEVYSSLEQSRAPARAQILLALLCFRFVQHLVLDPFGSRPIEECPQTLFTTFTVHPKSEHDFACTSNLLKLCGGGLLLPTPLPLLRSGWEQHLTGSLLIAAAQLLAPFPFP